MTPFQKGEDDEDISTIQANSGINHPPPNMKDINQGLITRSYANKLNIISTLLGMLYYLNILS
jgi:hypothetical protein